MDLIRVDFQVIRVCFKLQINEMVIMVTSSGPETHESFVMSQLQTKVRESVSLHTLVRLKL